MVSSKEWKDQWTMTYDEWKVIQAEAKNAIFPQDCLKVFENGGLRRVSPNIAGKMLQILGNKVQSVKMDRFERAGIRRDPRFAHLVGLTARRSCQNSEEFKTSACVKQFGVSPSSPARLQMRPKWKCCPTEPRVRWWR